MRKATQAPSAEIAGWSERPLVVTAGPVLLRLASTVVPVVRSWTKTSALALVSDWPVTRFVPVQVNAT